MAQRASATDVTLQVGLLSVTGNLYAIAKTPDSTVRLTNLCPTCHAGGAQVKTHTVHTCPSKHIHPAKEVLKATGPAKALKIVGAADEVKEAKAEANDGPGRTINLTAYPAEDVEASTFPIGTPWVFAATDDKNLALTLFRETITQDGRTATDSGDAVLLGEVQLRADSTPKLVSLRTRDGLLLVQEMARPENMNGFDSPQKGEITSKQREMFSMALSASVEDFKAEDVKATSVERFAQFVTSRIGEGILALSAPVEDEAEAEAKSLDEQLAAMLAAAKA